MQARISQSSISRALSSASNPKELRKTHALIITLGLDQPVFFSGKLISKYAELRDPSSSLSVFQRVSPTANIYQWNSIIRALSHSGLFSKAIEFYKKLRETVVLPDKYTFTSVINACAGLLDFEMGKLVHEHAVGMGFGSDLYIGNSVIYMYARFGSFDKARNMFDEMPHRDLVSWNSLISGYSSNGYWKETLEIYQRSRIVGFIPDSFTVSSVLFACGGLVVVGEGQAIHGLAEKIGVVSDVLVSNGLISMYLKFSRSMDARRVFNETDVRDSVSYNTIICGYFQLDLIEETVKLFKEMVDHFRPDILTVTSVLRACGQLKDLQFGKFVHNYMVRTGLKCDTTACNILIDMYGKCGDLLSAKEVLARIETRDSVSWNSIINGYVQRGDFSEVMKLFKMMRMEVKIDSVTYLMLLSVSTHLAYLDLGREIHSEATKSGFDSDLSVNNALIDMYVNCREMSNALKIFDNMKAHDIVTWNTIISASVRSGDFTTGMRMTSLMRNNRVMPDVATILGILPMCSSLAAKQQGKEIHGCILRLGFESHIPLANALIEMYSKCGCLKKSVQVFECMKSRDVVTWTALIYAYGMYGEGKKALEVFSEMEETGIVPDHIAFVAVIYACSHSCLVEEGLACFDQMRNYNIDPQIEHYTCVVDLLSRSRQISKAEEFIHAMPMKPDASIWASLLSACRASGDMETAERASRRIIELNPEDSGYSVLASNVYASIGKWDKVSLLRKSVKCKGLKKDPGCSWIEIRKRIHVFKAGDHQLVEQFDEIYKLLETLSGLMAKEGYVADLKDVLQNLEEDEKKQVLCGHSERLAIAFGLLNSEPGMPLQVMKNLRVCGDCHNVTKYISKIVGREILVRDANRFHLFKDGTCSCGDRW